MALWPKTETDWEIYGEAEALGAPMDSSLTLILEELRDM